jgi:outer membrane scaffolding protein for murein synthesis (MipA/OmpV family)
VSTITLGVGGWFTTKLTGGDEKEAPVQQAAPVINITNSQTQQSGGGKTVIINKGGDGSAKPAPAPKPKKKEGDEFKEEAPKW